MKIVGLCSWYDERPAWLAGLVASLQGSVDHLIAIDGAYALYPRGRAHSPTGQAEAIRETARASGIGCTIHEPRTAWLGNEVEKRDQLFRFGEQITTAEDWYFVMDGDQLLTTPGCDLHGSLSHTAWDCGEVTFWQYRQHFEPHERPFVSDRIEEFPIRVLFRAIQGLAVHRKHYVYETPDGRQLWGDGQMEPAADFKCLRIEHRNLSRDAWRDKSAKEYYELRDRLNVEGLTA